MRERKKLSKRVVEAAETREKQYAIWDGDLAGFGVYVFPKGQKSYIVNYRIGRGRSARQRRITLGRHGELTCEEARQKAADFLAEARLGEDPGAELRVDPEKAVTVEKLIIRWARDAAPIHRRTGRKRSPANVLNDVKRLQAHIVPLIGKRSVTDLDKRDIERVRDAITTGKTAQTRRVSKHGTQMVKGGAGTAARTVRTFLSVLAHAQDLGLIDVNPAKGVRLQPSASRERFLSQAEAERLGAVLSDWEEDGAMTHGIPIIRLLALTGARRSEISSLKWSEIDFDRGFLRLEDSKTGRSIRPLSQPALDLLRSLPRESDIWVFPGQKPDAPFVGIQSVWERVRKQAGLEDVRLHDLRHSFASFAAQGGLSLPIIGVLLGHKDSATTQRYAHLADDPARRAADQTADMVSKALGL